LCQLVHSPLVASLMIARVHSLLYLPEASTYPENIYTIPWKYIQSETTQISAKNIKQHLCSSKSPLNACKTECTFNKFSNSKFKERNTNSSLHQTQQYISLYKVNEQLKHNYILLDIFVKKSIFIIAKNSRVQLLNKIYIPDSSIYIFWSHQMETNCHKLLKVHL
jgi:hypothetical protein